jgi:hypothetical protein
MDLDHQIGDGELQLVRPQATRLVPGREPEPRPEIKQDVCGLSDDELSPYLEGIESELLAFGHLHIPYVRPVGDVLLVDVSSVGHPKDRDRRSAFTVVEWSDGCRAVTQWRVPYDIERVVGEYRSAGIPDAEHHIASLLKASY